jgi:hypothetical protein
MIMMTKTILRAAAGICLAATAALYPLAGTPPPPKAVANSVIFEIKADMGPEGMPTMTAPTKELPGPQPGL